MKPRICLNMIVKDEAHVIRRCLDSVRPLIDTWVIVDTGSGDGTQQIIREHLRDLPGELHERPWKNFGHNRSEALALARDKAEFTLIMDADDWLELPASFRLPALDDDVYQLLFAGDGLRYWRPALVRSRLDWRYVGVLHEYIHSDQPSRRSRLEGPTVISRREGGRSQGDPVRKYARDAEILEQGLRDEPDNSRYVFYLAQSYRDSQQITKALQAYERRAAMGGWDEEVWYASFQVALLSERLGLDEAVVVQRYLQAYQLRPQRAETLVNLARYYREHGQRYALAHLFAQRAVAVQKPDDILFLDEATYAWRGVDEYAIACYWIGQYEASASLCQQLLASPALPAEQRSRVADNLNFALRKLGRAEITIDPAI